MGKIFYIMGKSSAGKDTIFKKVKEMIPKLRPIVLYTTRPIREGETDGVEYFFTNKAGLDKMQAAGKVVESRTYDTVHGEWIYFTADDGQIDLKNYNYIAIGTLVSYEKIRAYFGKEAVLPIYIEVEDGERLFRALLRERRQEEPKYAEMCRRFLADTEDFSEENLVRLGVTHRFYNQNVEECIEQIVLGIREKM